MRRTLTCKPDRRAAYEPLYDTDPLTGARIEVFFADPQLAKSFGLSRSGWFWWSCFRPGLALQAPTGPFWSRYTAYKDAAIKQGLVS